MRTASQRKLEGLRPQVLKLVENLTKWRRPPIGDLRLHHFEQIVSWMLGKGGQDPDATAIALALARDGLNKSVDCSSTHRKLSRADGLFRVSLVIQHY